MRKNKIELLAPAGSLDALKAAVSAGADAVYLGSALFGARVSAGFDEDTLREAVRIAHLYDRKIHVTVNTLCKEDEFPALKKTLESLRQMHVDAILVQDIGVLSLCLSEFPELPIHASTQMALNNESAAKWLKGLGVSRIVLARECPPDEIRRVTQTGIETEVFTHGALCVAASGQCLFSSLVGGRSGNRGRCAQPCRMQYTYRGKTAAWLSPADLCTRDDLPALIDAGIDSLKIEGRLKRPEYVYTVASTYRKAIDSVLGGTFAPADRQERDSLTQIFSRGAFTRGYQGGCEDADIIYPDRVTPIGLPIGRVKTAFVKNGIPLCTFVPERTLNNGDGLEIGTESIIYSGPDVPQGETATLRLHNEVSKGVLIRRTEDEMQLQNARDQYEGDALQQHCKIPFDAELRLTVDKPADLTVTANGVTCMIQGEIVQASQTKPIGQDDAQRSIGKTGGTPFELRSLHFSGDNAYLPASALNKLRRDALEMLEQKLIEKHEASIPKKDARPLPDPAFVSSAPRLIVRTNDIDLVNNLLEQGADFVYYSPNDYRKEALEPILASFPEKTAFCLPAVCSEDTLQMLKALTDAYSVPVILGCAGQFGLFDNVLGTDFSVPVMNSIAEKTAAIWDAKSVVLSPEMSEADIKNLPSATAERILPVYGREKLMILTHCPERTYRGLTKGHAQCTLCDAGSGTKGQSLTDRRGFRFPLSPVRYPEGCRVTVLNSAPTSLISRSRSLINLRVSWLISQTDEERDTFLRIVRLYRAAFDGQTSSEAVPGIMGRFSEGIL